MILIFSLILSAIFILLCGKALRSHPAPFYIVAAMVSILVIGCYWLAPDFVSLQMRTKLPILLGALGTACFVFVMYAGALPNGSVWMKRIMPIRGELSIFACLLTLGHNLSYAQNYFKPGYLFSNSFSTTQLAAWISLILIALMLVLTITSIKAVRKRFAPKKWKSLQRWAYLFYGFTYVHVLLLAVPKLLMGRKFYLINLVVYSVVYLGYAVCRIQKAVLLKQGQVKKVTGVRQLAGFGIGIGMSVLLATVITLPNQTVENDRTAESSNDSVLVVESKDLDSSSESIIAEEDAPPFESSTTAVEDVFGEILTPVEDEVEPEVTPDIAIPAKTETAIETEIKEEVVAPPEVFNPVIEEPTEEAPATVAVEEPVIEPAPEPTPEPMPEAIVTSKYKDGTYIGTGDGYYGSVTVSVTIFNDTITAIEVTGHSDDEEYMGDAQAGVISSILIYQSADVSAVSGATFSSEGIMDAVADALKQAEN